MREFSDTDDIPWTPKYYNSVPIFTVTHNLTYSNIQANKHSWYKLVYIFMCKACR